MENIEKKIGRPKGSKPVWTADMEAQLAKLFPNTDNKDIASVMGLSISAIRSKSHIMKLRKSTRYWTSVDCKWLVDHWDVPGYGFQEIQNHFPHKTKWAIINKYRSLTGKRLDNKKP